MATPIFSAIALDLGTTAIKAGLLDGEGNLGSIVAQPAPEITVSGGRYESAALAYAQVAEQVLDECIAQAGGAHSLPLGLCSQRSSFLIWERASSQPLTPLISWQDNRGAASCDALRDSEGMIRELTGLRLTQYYFAPKLRVVLQEHPDWHARLERGELLAGTLDTFLVWRWTGGKHHVTDASMAARTLLMDIRQQQWSPALCDLFGIPLSILPEIKPTAGLNLQLDNGLTLKASLGDQSAALIASVGSSRSDVLVNLGTGGFAMRYMEEGEAAQDGYLRTLVYQDSKLRAHIAIEGTLNSLAAALAPYPVGDCRSEDFARDDVFCLAEPSGLGAPYFRDDLGIRFSASVDHMSPRQVGCLLLEGIVFRVARILEDFHRASAIGRVYLSGGLSELACLQQGIAQCAPCDVYRLKQKDASLQGAALLAAGMAVAPRIDAEKIQVTRNDQALPEKFRRWKGWFDSLL
ncbi:MAG TPA: FGGY family carbohydrate kinase [Gallionellaceae bacterium]|nr:FGGY family carbohydrate kinase [Gallionellaceae bacterium]